MSEQEKFVLRYVDCFEVYKKYKKDYLLVSFLEGVVFFRLTVAQFDLLANVFCFFSSKWHKSHICYLIPPASVFFGYSTAGRKGCGGL